jgi:DNA invertase Pin-like site-specific DNA recombinase
MTDGPSAGHPWGPPAQNRPWSAEKPPDAKQVPVSVPVAWLGRTSTEDSQDPTLSLPRQLANARKALPPGWVIVAHFYDVESGRKDLALRGDSQAFARFDIPIPRDGSIKDLLAEAQRPDRRFAAVICESIERVARRTYFGTKIEYELEQAGVALCAADEPIVTGRGAKKATPTLTRRVKQAVAEWYVLQMLELSWDGFVEHTQQGWNTGKPPYGYLAEKVAHPVPARRAEGGTKHRLVPDPLRASTVTRIFQLRALERMGCTGIADRLNLNLANHPVPEPTRAWAACGRWTTGAVREILRNPKYTGYQVWNRRSTKKGGKNVDPAEWVWSPRPTHEPLVSKEMFDAAAAMIKHRERSREAPGLNPHPAALRAYVLRSFIRCDLCGRRMFGKSRSFGKDRNNSTGYYACTKDLRQNHAAPWFPDHPNSIMVREDKILSAVGRFFAERVFGPDRRHFLARDIATIEASHTREEEQARQRQALEQTVADLENQQQRLIRNLASGGVGDIDPLQEVAFRDAIRREYATIGEQVAGLRSRQAELAAVRVADSKEEYDRLLLEALPRLDLNIDDLPEAHQRRIYEIFGLELRYNRRTEELRIKVTLNAEHIQDMNGIIKEVAQQTGHERKLTWPLPPASEEASESTNGPGRPPVHRVRERSTSANGPGRIQSHLLSAPGRIRTFAPASGGCEVPDPTGLRKSDQDETRRTAP